jgi:hypothetical protein
MGSFVEMLKRPGRASVIWLDSCDYAGRLLAGGAAPWLDVAAFVAWQRKAQGLLKSSVVSLPVARVIAAWLEAHPELRETMAAKTRAVHPLKILLSDEALRAHLVELTRGLRSGVGGVLALTMPSPRAWVGLAYQQAHGEVVNVGEDEADSGSVYIADFLRAFGETGLDALLLQEFGEPQPVSSEELRAYQAVFNVAAHYRWDVGLRVPKLTQFSGDAPLPLAFVVAAESAPVGLPYGAALAAEFWTDAAQPAAADVDFLFAEIPEDAEPELVLDRLSGLS